MQNSDCFNCGQDSHRCNMVCNTISDSTKIKFNLNETKEDNSYIHLDTPLAFSKRIKNEKR